MTAWSTYGDTTTYPWTTAAIEWWPSSANWVANTSYTSPELKTVVQEIVDLAGWTSGNAIQIEWHYSGVEIERYSVNWRQVRLRAHDLQPADSECRVWEGVAESPCGITVKEDEDEGDKAGGSDRCYFRPILNDTDFKSLETAYVSDSWDRYRHYQCSYQVRRHSILLKGDGYFRHVSNILCPHIVVIIQPHLAHFSNLWS